MEEPFRASVPDGTQLIETFGWRPEGGAPRWPRHRARFLAAAARLGFPAPEAKIDRAVAAIAGGGALRCRLTLDAQGQVALTTAPAGESPQQWRVGLAAQRLASDDPWLQVKSTQRQLYDQVRADLPDGVDEVLFLNERDELCEGTITNLFVERADGQRVTPPLYSGVLPGVLREALLQDGWEEAPLCCADLDAARAIWVGNSLRGLIPGQWCPPR